jgi:hypothetical protein
MAAFDLVVKPQATIEWRARLAQTRPELEADIKAAVAEAFERLSPPDEMGDPNLFSGTNGKTPLNEMPA